MVHSERNVKMDPVMGGIRPHRHCGSWVIQMVSNGVYASQKAFV
jgi:hypothetical protein